MYLNADLRRDSGSVQHQNKLISFLYELMRDELSAGKVELIMKHVDMENHQVIHYSNGWLAEYAANMAKRLTELDYKPTDEHKDVFNSKVEKRADADEQR